MSTDTIGYITVYCCLVNIELYTFYIVFYGIVVYNEFCLAGDTNQI